MVFLWLTATVPGARPPECNSGDQCAPPGTRHLAWLLAGFAFLSLGAGGVRPCSMAFGADQFSRHPKQRRLRILQAYFNAYYASIGVAFTVAVTAIVYLQDNVSWNVGFAVPMGLMLLSTVSFFLGSSLYIKEKGKRQMFAGIGSAVSAAIRNRRARLPDKAVDGVYHHLKDCKLAVPTDKLRYVTLSRVTSRPNMQQAEAAFQLSGMRGLTNTLAFEFRFLNKACLLRGTKEDALCNGSDAAASERHGHDGKRPCTVDQVEQLKSAIRVLPIWSSTIFLALALNQSFAVKQADTMDRSVGAGRFRVPSGSLAVFNMATMSLWSASYDRWVAPALQRYTGNSRGLTMKQRIGGGLLLATASTAVSAVVEGARRRRALRGVTISAFWLVPQFALAGLAEAFGIIGEIEFFYTELPKSMASFSMSLLYMAFGVGNLAGALIVKVVQVASKRGGRTGWLVDNLNVGHYDYYYLVLAVLCAANVVYFVVCGWAYGEEGQNRVVAADAAAGEDDQEEEHKAVII